ncbi:hypothetical protein ECZU17_61420 [Escherichia coli]|nr:hypothetical protein ECZU17_61420 [Escherichia coli]
MFRTVYCHLHGEPTRNGRILHTHYATGQQAEARLNTVISVASVPVATNPPGIRFRTRWTV